MKQEPICVSVGRTRSGKAILYSPSAMDIELVFSIFVSSEFTTDDFLDVFAVFSFLTVRAIRRKEESERFERYAIRAANMPSQCELIEARERADVRSAFDLRRLGKALVSVEFSDF